MKKLISVLGTLTLTATSATSVVACNTAKGDLIYFVTPETTNEYFDNLEKVAKTYVETNYKDEYRVTSVRSDNDVSKEQSNLESAMAAGSKGIMFVPVQTASSPGVKAVVDDGEFPIVAVDRVLASDANIKVDASFYTDGAIASKSMAYALYEQITSGRADVTYGDRIETIYIKGSLSADSTISRHKGFMENAVFTDEMITKARAAGNETVKAGETIFRLPDGIKGTWVGETMETTEGINLVTNNAADVEKAKLIVSMNDPMALGAVQAISANSTLKAMMEPKSGDDLGLIVVGFDANDSARTQIANWKTNKVQLFGSVAQDPKSMAEQAVQFIIDEIENGRTNKGKDSKVSIDTTNVLGI